MTFTTCGTSHNDPPALSFYKQAKQAFEPGEFEYSEELCLTARNVKKLNLTKISLEILVLRGKFSPDLGRTGSWSKQSRPRSDRIASCAQRGVIWALPQEAAYSAWDGWLAMTTPPHDSRLFAPKFEVFCTGAKKRQRDNGNRQDDFCKVGMYSLKIGGGFHHREHRAHREA